MMFWCHAELTRTFNCVNLCVFMFTQVCFIPLCQIFMHMKPSFVSAGCVWISRGQNVSSLLSYRRAASKSVCVCVCVRSPWILPFELFTDMEQGWALQHAAGQQYGNWYHFFSLWLCFVGRLDNLHVKVGFGVCAFLLKLSWGFITYRLEQFLWKYSASLRVEIKTTAGGAQLSRRWWWWVWSECAVTSLNMNCFQLQLWEPQEDGERSRTGRTFFFLFFFYWHW